MDAVVPNHGNQQLVVVVVSKLLKHRLCGFEDGCRREAL